MPFPGEHSCRLHAPSQYQKKSFRRIKRGKLVLIIARPKGKTTTRAQAYRYPTKNWTADQAKAHCERHGGRFIAARKS